MIFTLHLTVALGCLALAAFVWFQERGQLVRPILAAALMLQGLQKLLSAFLVERPLTLGIQLPWLVVSGLLLAAWLAFSLTYGRADARHFLVRWKSVLIGTVVVPLLLIFLPVDQFFASLPLRGETTGDGVVTAALFEPGTLGPWYWPLGLRGYLFFVVTIVAYTLVVANLEKTLRNSFGRVRWQIKFAVLGIGGYAVAVIYTSSDAILFRTWSSSAHVIQAWALLCVLPLLAIALRRGRTLQFDIYLSQSVLQGSITIVAVGAYLVGVGVVVQVLRLLDWPVEMPTVVVFVALLGAGAFLLSDRVRQDLRLATRRHFQRPTHDYRRIWTRFNQGITDRFDEQEVARTAARITAQALDSLTVSVWTLDAAGRGLRLAASTGLTREDAAGLDLSGLLERATSQDGVVAGEVSGGGTGNGKRETGNGRETRIQNSEFRIQKEHRGDRRAKARSRVPQANRSLRAFPLPPRNSKPETRNQEPETRNQEPETRNQERREAPRSSPPASTTGSR